jgi:type III restriction enzyme
MNINILEKNRKDTIEKLLEKSKKILNTDHSKSNEEKLMILKSTAGGRKFFIMARYMYKLTNDETLPDFCFLWISTGKGNMHKQSYKIIKEELGGHYVYLLENEFTGGRRVFRRNEIVVVNWEKLTLKDKETGEWKSNLMKDKETYNFRDLIKNTKEDGRKIIMIINESQANARAKRAMDVREIIGADLTIEINATTPLEKTGHDSLSVEKVYK